MTCEVVQLMVAAEKEVVVRLVMEAADEADVAAQQLCKARERHGCVAEVFDRAEEEVNRSQHDLKISMESTVAATSVAQMTGLKPQRSNWNG